jgi:methionyl-tRNA formyltransferase
MKKQRIIFIGTPKFSVPCLKALLDDSRFEIVAVITQPDMPAGRSMELTPPPVKIVASSYGLQIFQPPKISHIIDNIRDLAPDAIVVVAYAQIIPESILKIPPFGCVNVHGSLLPKYRGASVLQAPLMNGDAKTGVTIMLMDKTLDTGPMLRQAEYHIKPEETADTLAVALSDLGARTLPNTLADYLNGLITPEPQDNTLANYVGRLEKKDGIIDWLRSANEIEKFVRAMTSWPSAWTWTAGKQLKILEVDPHIVEINSQKPGKTFMYNSCLAVQCGTDSLLVRRLQLEGKKPMTSEEFIRGYKDFIGSVLG